jgi:hypothetical protein
LQYEKHSEQRNATLWGITVDWSDEWEKADNSIRVNREFVSKEIDEREGQ